MQNKKSAPCCGKYILVVAILIFIISGGILGYFYNKEDTISIPSNLKEVAEDKGDQEEKTVIVPEEKWKTYVSSELGFSIEYPEMVYGVYKCSPQKLFWVPLKVFEDKKNGIVYITQEYYYSDWDSELQNNTGHCEKIINSLEYLKNQREIIIDINNKTSLNYNPFLTRVFIVKNIKNDIELNKFIKDNYGSGCFVEKKELWEQKGVYKIKIKGEDWDKGADLGITTCPWNYIYKILYAPEKNKLMSVNLGQECGFGINYDSENYKCYDNEMINSFKFK